MLNTLSFVFYTECVLLLRRSQEWIYPLAFFTIVVCFFPLAFSPDLLLLQKIIPGSLWIAALLASLLSIQFVFFADCEDGHLEQLLFNDNSFSLLLFAKLSAHWLITELPLLLLTPILGMLFHLSVHVIFMLCLTLLIGTPILTFIGCFGVALTLGLRQQGVLLGLLILPLVTPVLIFGVNIVQQFALGFEVTGALAFLAGLTVLTMTIMPFAIATTLRISLDN